MHTNVPFATIMLFANKGWISGCTLATQNRVFTSTQTCMELEFISLCWNLADMPWMVYVTHFPAKRGCFETRYITLKQNWWQRYSPFLSWFRHIFGNVPIASGAENYRTQWALCPLLVLFGNSLNGG